MVHSAARANDAVMSASSPEVSDGLDIPAGLRRTVDKPTEVTELLPMPSDTYSTDGVGVLLMGTHHRVAS
jgi:hypothetical protein